MKGESLSSLRAIQFALLIIVAWVMMLLSHEIGHIVGGKCCGAKLISFDLLPWHMPFSLFEPDPYPLVTLWSGPVLGAFVPVLFAWAMRADWAWFIAHFCLLANGSYLVAGWFSGDSQLDTTKLLENGAHPIAIILYCSTTVVWGYAGFRENCRRLFAPTSKSDQVA